MSLECKVGSAWAKLKVCQGSDSDSTAAVRAPSYFRRQERRKTARVAVSTVKVNDEVAIAATGLEEVAAKAADISNVSSWKWLSKLGYQFWWQKKG